MSVAHPISLAQPVSLPAQKSRHQHKLDKAKEKHQRHLRKFTPTFTLAEPETSKQHGKTERPILSEHFPLDQFITPLRQKHKQKTNPFANVKCDTAQGILEQIGLKLEPAHGAHHKIKTKPSPGHTLSQISIHPGKPIPAGTHTAILRELNSGFIRLLNQADETVSDLPPETQDKFRSFVAKNLAEAGATNREDILPDDLLSTQDHSKIKALHALVENANPDTVFNIWRKEPAESSASFS